MTFPADPTDEEIDSLERVDLAVEQLFAEVWRPDRDPALSRAIGGAGPADESQPTTDAVVDAIWRRVNDWQAALEAAAREPRLAVAELYARIAAALPRHPDFAAAGRDAGIARVERVVVGAVGFIHNLRPPASDGVELRIRWEGENGWASWRGGEPTAEFSLADLAADSARLFAGYSEDVARVVAAQWVRVVRDRLPLNRLTFKRAEHSFYFFDWTPAELVLGPETPRPSTDYRGLAIDLALAQISPPLAALYTQAALWVEQKNATGVGSDAIGWLARACRPADGRKMWQRLRDCLDTPASWSSTESDRARIGQLVVDLRTLSRRPTADVWPWLAVPLFAVYLLGQSSASRDRAAGYLRVLYNSAQELVG